MIAHKGKTGSQHQSAPKGTTIRQYLRERLIDELHLVISPVLLGAGERLFEGLHLPDLGYACTQHVGSERATHLVLTRM